MFHLLPFSRAELSGRRSPIIDKIGRSASARKGSSEALAEVLFRGFYPRIHDQNLDPQEWLRNYYQTYVERDVRDLLNVGDIETFGRFVRLCAGRCGQLLNLASLGADCGVSHATARRWVSVLEASFLLHLLRPHHANFGKRLVKSPKLYFLDTGLLCYLLRIRAPDDLAAHPNRGAVFETFLFSELLKAYIHTGAEPDMYFWRDSTGHEVDFLLDRGIDMIAVEAKSGETFTGDSLKGLEYWRAMTNKSDCQTVLVYGGESSFLRNGTRVYSWRDWL